MKRLLQAASFAAEKHRDLKRKDVDETPYVNHVLEVAKILATVGDIDDRDILIAALLHDTIEDTQTTADELREHFGDRVTDFVLEVTDDKSLLKEERKRLQVVNAPHKSEGAKQIKIADKISNLRSILTTPPADWDSNRKTGYFKWANDVFQGLKGVNSALDREFSSLQESAQRPEALASQNTLPRSQFQVGDVVRVIPSDHPKRGTPWQKMRKRELVRHLLKKYRRSARKKEFIFDGDGTGPLSSDVKDAIRESVRVLENYDCLEIAGIIPHGSNVGTPFFPETELVPEGRNCGVRYDYLLCYRYTDKKGKKCAYIPEIPTVPTPFITLADQT